LRSSKAPSAASIIGPGHARRIADQRSDRLVAARAVQHAVEKVDVAFFLGKEMVERQSAEVAILQVSQLFEEDDRAAVAIAVEQGELALRFFLQCCSQKRQDWRDARAASNPDKVTLGGRREFGREAAVRRHDFDRVAGLEAIADPVRKNAAGDALDRDHPVLLGRRSAQRVVAANFLTADGRFQRQMLPGFEGESVAKFGGDFEADRIGFGGLGNDLRDLQRVEMRAHYQVASG
jgi:hypothetical protein